MAFDFQPTVMWESVPLLIPGLILTLRIAVFGILLGLAIGIIVGVANSGKSRFLKILSGIYIEIVRGTPLIVLAMVLYFGLPMLLGTRLLALNVGIVVIGVNAGAYISEIVRGAILSIDAGQTEAARSTGLNQLQTMYHIIWPQAFRRMIPPLGNQFIISLKDTSLLSIIGVAEMTRRAQEVISITFRSFEVWITVACIYLCFTLSLSLLLRYMERRLGARVMRRAN